MPTKLLKKVLKHCMPTLTKVINLSLNTGKFHDGWKSAVVRPLIKSLPKGITKTNYRPVNNLSFISKIVEKCTLKQFTQHCNNYDLLLSCQSAYRKFHGCETSLVKLVNDLIWAMENQQVTWVVILDLPATPNTIWPWKYSYRVLHNLFRISGSALKWYTTYLNQKKIQSMYQWTLLIRKKQCISVYPNNQYRVPFCSLPMHPTLQKCYQTHFNLMAYVDDHSIRKSFNPYITLNKLKLNEPKTEFIYLGSRQQLKKCQHKTFNINIETINRSTKVKNLRSHLYKKTKIQTTCTSKM